MNEKGKVFSFDSEFSSLKRNLSDTKETTQTIEKNLSETSDELKDLLDDLRGFDIPVRILENSEDITAVASINKCINDIVDPDYHDGINLNATDIIVPIAAGAIASVIDIALVGTPEVVKIYKGGENFDGSILTKALRNIGNGDDKLSELLHWFSEKCTVPYDISVVKDTVYPDNHRLRSFGHDPLMGVLFSMVDIILGTATLVDNNGHLRIIVNPKDYPESEKFLALIYYLGHLLSDVCTARGLPIPGMILTQFFRDGTDDNHSIGAIVEQMYRDGYDLRHLASMKTPVIVKNLIIELYIRLFRSSKEIGLQTIAEKEIANQQAEAYKYRLILISDAVSCGGNVIKFFLPPTCGNITALNLPEWCSLIKNAIAEMKYQLRDKSIEKVLQNREAISKNWMILLENLEQ